MSDNSELKAINFRPTDNDAEVFALIMKTHPITCTTAAAAIRKALEHYWYTMGPDKGSGRYAKVGDVLAVVSAHAAADGVDVDAVLDANRERVQQ